MPERFQATKLLPAAKPGRRRRADNTYRGARPADRSQSLRSCFDRSYDTAAAGADSNILGANILDTALDCAVSGAAFRQISNALVTQSEVTDMRRSPLGQAKPPLAVINKSAMDNPEVG